MPRTRAIAVDWMTPEHFVVGTRTRTIRGQSESQVLGVPMKRRYVPMLVLAVLVGQAGCAAKPDTKKPSARPVKTATPPSPPARPIQKQSAPATASLPTAGEVRAAIRDSDDFDKYADAFTRASLSLIERRRCSLSQLREMGGWVRSQSHNGRPVYFTYCGASNVSNRIYLDASTGEIFK